MTQITRAQIESFYEEETGLSAKHGSRRVDILQRAISEKNVSSLSDVKLTDEPNEINHGWRKGRRWSAGKEIEGKVCLGYSNRGTRRDNCVNAIFATFRG